MLDYQLQPNSRRCHVTGRELEPGEPYYSVLLDQDGQIVRREYSREAWQSPPENVFSYWVGHVPEPDSEKRPPPDDDFLLECFQRLQQDQDVSRQHFRYVLALLLMRRKRLKFEGMQRVNDQECLRLSDVQNKEQYLVPDPDLSEEQMATVQEEVFQILGW